MRERVSTRTTREIGSKEESLRNAVAVRTMNHAAFESRHGDRLGDQRNSRTDFVRASEWVNLRAGGRGP